MKRYYSNLSFLNNYLQVKPLLIIIVISCIVVLCGQGCFATPKEKQLSNAIPHYNKALEDFLNGQYPLAKDEALLAIREYNEYVEAHILYQRIQARNRETKALLKEYKELMKSNPGNDTYIYLFGRLLDDLEEQERYCQKVIDLNENNAWGYFGLGWTNYKRSRYADATENFEKAVKIEPNNALFHMNLGSIYYLRGHSFEALDELRKATQLSPKLVSAWLALAATYYKQAEYEKAVESLRKYINNYPDAPDKKEIEKLILQINGGKLTT